MKMTKLKLWKIIESKSYENGEEVFLDGDFRLEVYEYVGDPKNPHLGGCFIGKLKMYGCDFNDVNGLIYFDCDEELDEFVKRLFDNNDSLDELTTPR
jgi:hypothetical protein